MTTQRQAGRFYTQGNPFNHPAFAAWADEANLSGTTILEPFAGENSLIHQLQEMDLCRDFRSYDIQPGNGQVIKQDTLSQFPKGFETCVTNPPWLARNVASRLGMRFPECEYQDLFAHALDKCLSNCNWVAALVPESYLRSGLFRERLRDFVSLTQSMFGDTTHPVGLALFGPNDVSDSVVWSGSNKVGFLSEIESLRPRPAPTGPKVRFNIPDGNVGLLAVDNVWGASIRFCDPEELGDYQVKHTRRSITILEVDGAVDISHWNDLIDEFRTKTCDVLMTPFRGLRHDGMYRRRLDWDLARGIIHHSLQIA